jgi:hypothetical protein
MQRNDGVDEPLVRFTANEKICHAGVGFFSPSHGVGEQRVWHLCLLLVYTDDTDFKLLVFCQ